MVKALHHIHRHLKDHHRKYLFGIFGGYAIVKLVILVLGLSVVQYAYHATFAQLTTGCTFTGQYYTGAYETGGYRTGQALTGGFLEGCVTLTGYRTGGFLDESGSLSGQTWVEELSQTGCILTGQQLTGGYYTGSYLTGGYRTGGYFTGCFEEVGIVQTGVVSTGISQSGTSLTGINAGRSNGICESKDIIWNSPKPSSISTNTFLISRTYSGNDCLSGLSLQLWDHNNQWISLPPLAPGTTGYVFDSLQLAVPQDSGFYHILGTGATGQYYQYTGIATGSYLSFYSGYKLRLLAYDQTPIYETQAFTINNENPLLTGIRMVSKGSTTGFVNVSGTVILTFTSNQPLSGVIVTLGSGMTPRATSVSGFDYTFSRTISSGYKEGVLSAYIAYLDKQSHISYFLYTGSLVFDMTAPLISGLVFTSVSSGASLAFSGSEPTIYTIRYRKSVMNGVSTVLSGYSSEYLTSQQLMFTGLEVDQLYFFAMNIYDGAGNARFVTGDVLQTALGTILSHTYLVPISISTQTTILSGTIGALSAALKSEIEKFNTCKNTLKFSPISLDIRSNVFTIQMPQFQKAQMKTLVNAFALFVIDKIKHNYSMSSGNIAEITKKFDNFLVILKLIRDDDNSCKQNLSNYHISQFQKALEEYNIALE